LCIGDCELNGFRLSFVPFPIIAVFSSAHHCSVLSGEWSGKSVRTLPGGGGVVETVWASTRLSFDAGSGTLKGDGVSLWQDQTFPFQLLGAFNPQLNQVEMLKSHRTAGASGVAPGAASPPTGSVTHFACTLDLASQTISGQFGDAHGGGGSVLLQRVQQVPGGAGPPQNAQVGSFGNLVARSASGSSQSSTPGPPMHLLPTEAPPADLADFLRIAFPDAPGVANKILQSLKANEIHEADSLVTLSPEDWKELGVVLGHRSKIKLALQRCYPHLMMKGGLGTGMDGADPSQQSSVGGAQSQGSSAEPANVPYQQQGGVPPQFVGAGGGSGGGGGGAPGFGAGSHYAPLPSSQSQQQAPQPPLEFLCPITHELMVDPVILTADGHSYERLSIEQWLLGHKTSPITNKIVASKHLQPHYQLRNNINMWKQQFQIK
jgi:hypothetical protein